MVKLKDLRPIILSDLTIIDHIRNIHVHVWTEGKTFNDLREKEVIGIRPYKDTIIISLQKEF